MVKSKIQIVIRFLNSEFGRANFLVLLLRKIWLAIMSESHLKEVMPSAKTTIPPPAVMPPKSDDLQKSWEELDKLAQSALEEMTIETPKIDNVCGRSTPPPQRMEVEKTPEVAGKSGTEMKDKPPTFLRPPTFTLPEDVDLEGMYFSQALKNMEQKAKAAFGRPAQMPSSNNLAAQNIFKIPAVPVAPAQPIAPAPVVPGVPAQNYLQGNAPRGRGGWRGYRPPGKRYHNQQRAAKHREHHMMQAEGFGKAYARFLRENRNKPY